MAERPIAHAGDLCQNDVLGRQYDSGPAEAARKPGLFSAERSVSIRQTRQGGTMGWIRSVA
ncbi:MAG: hypothetical protein KA354_22140 [Phycisphaerae bacterium]|nr:hypothetical protein [Phycisphaerae bacterium]